MAVLHGNPDLQQGLIDAAADTTSAAVVAPLTFRTYFSLAGTADHEVDSPQVSHRHQNITSYFSDEDVDSSPSGGEEVVQDTRNDEDQDCEEDDREDDLPLDNFFLPPLSDSQGSSYVTKQRIISNCLKRKLVVTNPLTGSTQPATSFGPYTIPPKNLLQGFEVQSARRFEKSKIQRTHPAKWATITDHLDSCGAFDLVQRQYLHDIKPVAQYGMHPIRMSCLESTTDWYRDVGKDYVKDADGNANVRLAYAYDTPPSRAGKEDQLFFLTSMTTLVTE